MKVLVIGGGIAGLSTAWALTRAGGEATLVEQGPIPNPLSASGDHHRIIRRAYGGEDGYAHAITEAFEAWETLWSDLGRRHYQPRGVLGISQRPGDEAELFREGLDRTGYPYRLFDAEETAKRHPFLDPKTFRYSYLNEEGGALFCRRIASDLARWLVEHGADLRPHTRIVGVDPDQGRATTADGTVFSADQIVVAAGAWTMRLFPDLARSLTTYRTALAYLDPPPEFRAAWERAPVILDIGGEADGYIIPPADGIALKFGAGAHKRVEPDPDRDRIPFSGEGERLRDLFSPPLARIEEYRVRETTTCAYTFTSDQRFFSTRVGRALVVSACSGHGYKFGAAVGRRVASALQSGDDLSLARWLRAETA